MKEFILELLSNDYFVLCAMSIIICLITQLLKMPIKFFTNKIKNPNTEDRVTALLMTLPLALGVLLNFLYNVFYLKIAFSVIEGLSWGTASIMFYQGFKKLITGKDPTPIESEQINSVRELASKIASDGKIDRSDTNAINEYLNKVK